MIAPPDVLRHVDSRYQFSAGWYDVFMTDDHRHGQTPIDMGNGNAALMTLDVVAARFIAAGLPRSMRTLQRYCANGTLECVKEATDTGDTYFVVEQSIGTAIAALKQLHQAKDRPRYAATERAVTDQDAQDQASQNDGDTDGHSLTAPADDTQGTRQRQPTSGIDVSRHVAQLEARLEEKDEEIEFLREELIDRRGQIRDMKGIIDGQNQLLETIQSNVAPIFNALAATVKTNGISLDRANELQQNDLGEHSSRDDHGAGDFEGLRDGQA